MIVLTLSKGVVKQEISVIIKSFSLVSHKDFLYCLFNEFPVKLIFIKFCLSLWGVLRWITEMIERNFILHLTLKVILAKPSSVKCSSQHLFCYFSFSLSIVWKLTRFNASPPEQRLSTIPKFAPSSNNAFIYWDSYFIIAPSRLHSYPPLPLLFLPFSLGSSTHRSFGSQPPETCCTLPDGISASAIAH